MLWHIHGYNLSVKAKVDSRPDRIPNIIVGASQLSHEGRWIMYDRCFWLKASASRTRQWSTIDITIWNVAFPDRAIRSHPGQVFSLNPSYQHPPWMPICLDWNDSPNDCTQANCRYKHVCYRCVHNPKEQDKHHKASQCVAAQRLRKQSERPHPIFP